MSIVFSSLYPSMLPYGHCYLWQPALVRLHGISDGLIAAAFYSISLVLAVFAVKRKDVPLNWVLWLFAAFIFACGTTHLMAIWTVWHPDYWVEGILKAATALVSIWTALTLTLIIQQALKLPQLLDVERVNQELRAEIDSRKQAETALKESETNFRKMAVNVPGAIFRYILRPDGTDMLLYMSPGCYQLWEVEADIVEEDTSILWKLVHPEDLPGMQASVLESARTLETWNWEWRITTASGRQKWLQAIGQPAAQPDGAILWHTVILDVSDRKRAEKQLQDLTNRLELAARSAHIGIWEWNVINNRLIWDARMYELYGIRPEDFSETFEAWEAGIHPEDLATFRQAIAQALNGEEDFDSEFRVLWPDGTVRFVEAHAIVQRDGAGSPRSMIGVNWDITDRKQAETQLKDLTERLGLAIEAADMGIWEWDLVKDRLHWDQRMFALYNLQPDTFGNINQSWRSRVHPDDLPAVEAIQQSALRSSEHYEAEFRIIWPGGTIRHIASYALVQRDAEGSPLRMVGANLDISDRKQAEEQLIYRALHDGLTDLANRTLLTKRLELAIYKAQRSTHYHFAVLFLDLDQFKVINDSLGHLLGDELLQTIARKLQNMVRPTDLAARLGGDEFVILLEHVPDLQAAIHMAERLLQEFDSATTIDGHTVFITTSIGIVWGTQTYTEATDLLRDADIALYRAKAQGRRRYEIFDVEMHIQAVKRMTLEHDLRIALDQQQFVTYYQPIVDLNTSRLLGFEALIRWQHPTRGFVSPADFIPIAEETGLILSITQWVLQFACKQLVTWQQQFPQMKDLRVSINLSSRDLRQNNLVDIIQHILHQTQLSPHCLTLEITESILVENTEDAIDLLGQLRDLGIRISIDDFGTGYSSLNYLYNLPADYLKIDQSFVGNMQPGNKNYKIVQAVVGLSDQLQLAAIAEGIETAKQLEWLKALGCELGQGYLLSHPLPPEAVTTLLAAGRKI